MGRLILSAIGTSIGVLMVRLCVAIPMDTEAAKQLPRVEALAVKTQRGQMLSGAERAELIAFLKRRDPVLTSAAAWILARDVAKRDENLKALTEIEPKTYTMMAAFVKTAIARLSQTDEKERLARMREFVGNKNPYLQVEAASEIAQSDPNAGREIFRRLAQDKTNPARVEIARQVKKLDPQAQVEAVGAPEDDMYAIVLDVIQGPDVMASHTLRGETAQGINEPPFPTSIEKLRFAWELQTDAARDPVEIRWIAADTGGVAPKDHVISSSKSEPSKTEGTFSLSKPTSGFPPGKYRIELRQGGKIIYAEDFMIH